MKKKDVNISIFTPAYNRCYTLKKLYESIKRQTYHNFEWILVDDGSSDDTKNFSKIVEQEQKIKFRYYYQKNAGKPQAINRGAELASYEFFLCIDSDDFIADDCIENITKQIIQLNEIDDKWVGIITPRKNIAFPNHDFQLEQNIDKTSIQELYFKKKFKGETTLLIKTALLKKYKYPRFENEKFIPETWQYDIFDKIGYWYYMKDNICFYEYKEDGYTSNFSKLIKNNVKGFEEFSLQRMKLGKYFISKMKGAVYFDISIFIQKRYFRCIFNKYFIMTIAAIIPAMYIFHKKGLSNV